MEVLGARLGRVDVRARPDRPRHRGAGRTYAHRRDRAGRGGHRGLGVLGRSRESYDVVDESRAGALLEQFGIAALAGRTFGTLSAGERKRALVARALMADPELLLLDEPAAGMDLGGREDLVRRLADLAADPAAPVTVLVTHHVEEIPPGFTHALVLRDGVVVAQGPVAETITQAHLSEAFAIPLRVTMRDGRFWARARSVTGLVGAVQDGRQRAQRPKEQVQIASRGSVAGDAQWRAGARGRPCRSAARPRY